MKDTKEASARLIINKLLEEAGWQLTDDESGKANVGVENHIVVDSPKQESTLGDDFEYISGGFADYVLYGQNNKPIAVLEAKRSKIHPLEAKEQARQYAQKMGVRWVLLSNGLEHYQWNIEEGNPEQILRFPSQESLETNVSIARDINTLVNEEVGADYIALTQEPQYAEDPRWKSKEGRQEMIQVDGLRFLRDYQLDAIRSIQQAVGQGKKRFLFEMATGTGKTLTSAAIIKLFVMTQNASRVLFLVDRLELENQAYKNFRKYLAPDIITYIYKDHPDDWHRAEVVVTTIQSIMHDNKFEEIFNPNDFDLIISDESHRGISGMGLSRDVFEYFSGYKLGLTATPKNYLKNLDTEKLAQTDPREYERRVQMSTYRTFGCESGDPTFRYSLLDGVKDGYLINPYVLDCRTKVTTQLLSDEGYAVAKNADDEGDEEAAFHAKDFERNFFSPKTNKAFADLFFEKAQRDPISQEVGKTIMFCVSQNHARKMTQLLNERAHELYPDKYNSDFAAQITSNVRDAQPYTIRFANNNLNGSTRFLEGYKSSKTRVCVTVGMMTTGYDCPDLLNICLLRPIFSPQDFVQIKGRGTRKHTFSYTQRLKGQEATKAVEKETFYLFDFFANCEYFENDFPYDETPDLPQERAKLSKVDEVPTKEFKLSPEETGHTRYSPDQVQQVQGKQIGYEGMSVDKKLYAKLQDKAREAQEIKEESMKQAQALWDEFTNSHEVTHDDMSELRSLFILMARDEQLLTDVSAREFSKYADNPEIYNLFTALGKDWLEKISSFIKNAK